MLLNTFLTKQFLTKHCQFARLLGMGGRLQRNVSAVIKNPHVIWKPYVLRAVDGLLLLCKFLQLGKGVGGLKSGNFGILYVWPLMR